MLNKFRRIPYKLNKFSSLNTNVINVNHVVPNHTYLAKSFYTNNTNNTNEHNILIDSKENVGLKHFLSNIYYKTGAGILGTLATASTLTYMAPEFLFQNALALIIVGGIGSLGSIFLYKNNDYTLKKENYKGHLVPVAEHSQRNKLAYTGISICNGITIAPLILMSSAINPLILPAAFILSAGTMAGSSWYALSKKNNNITLWGPTLYGTLMGMVGMGLISLVTLPFFPQLAHLWFTVDPYIGIVLFSALNAYDTHQAVEKYKEGDYDDLGHSISFFLNFINLFVRFIELLSRFNKD